MTRAIAILCLLATTASASERRPNGRTGAQQRGAASRQMRAFWDVADRHGASQPLAGFDFVGVGHLQAAMLEQLEATSRAGIPRGRIAMMGKTTSDVPAVIRDGNRSGFRLLRGVPDLRRPFLNRPRLWAHYDAAPDEYETYDYHPRWVVENAIGTPRPGRTYLVMDDGGQLLEFLNEDPYYSKFASQYRGIETTHSGAERMRKLVLKFPVINVADSWIKLEHESPVIGHLAANKLMEHRAGLIAAGIDPGRVVLQRGYGKTGAATAKDLAARRVRGGRAPFEIIATDLRDDALDRAVADGFDAYDELDDALPLADHVISSTGTPTFGPRQLRLMKDGASVMNAASGTREIDYDDTMLRGPLYVDRRGHAIGGFQGRAYDLGPALPVVLQDRVLQVGGGKQVLLKRGGAVFTFDRDGDPIPPRYFQVTPGARYLGTLQAAKETRPGLWDLKLKPQEDLYRRIQAQLAETGEDLDHPTF